MIEQGYIKLHRSLLSWEWYDDPNTFRLFLHLLLTVNYEDKEWHGMTIKRGQRVCSHAKLAAETKLSVKSVRTALNHLKRTGEVAYQVTPQYGLVTVNNYCKFQELAQEEAYDGQTTGTQAADKGQQCKKDKKDKKEKNIPPISPTGDKKSKTPKNDALERKKEAKKEKTAKFDIFWAAYPKKTAKPTALNAFLKIDPSEELLETMLAAIKRQQVSEQWSRDNGQYIPYPATWLNQRRWEDEEKKASGKGSKYQWL